MRRNWRCAYERAEEAIEMLERAAAGGTAVGTGLNAHPEFAKRTIEKLSGNLGIPLHEDAEPFRSGGERVTRAWRRAGN